MAYNATYTSSDIAPMVIDFGLTVLGAVIGLAVVIGLVVLHRWFKGKKVMS